FVGRGIKRGVSKAAAVGSRVVRTAGNLVSAMGSRAERLRGRFANAGRRPGHEFAVAPDFTIIERDGAKAVRHGPMNNGPLEPEVAATFRSASYTARTIARPLDLYRVYSDPERMLGPFWSRTPPSGPLQATIDSALLADYGNAATRAIHIRVPPGETVFEGQVSGQNRLLGGGSQVYLLRVNPSWEVK